MPLSDEELIDVVHHVVAAEMIGDHDGVLAAIQPVTDMLDVYLLTATLVQMVANAVPDRVCPVHGADCPETPVISFGVLPVVDGQVDTSSIENGVLPSLPPELEAANPGAVAYMRMLVAALAADEAQSRAVFLAAVHNDAGPALLNTALQQAAMVTIAQKAGLQ